MLPTQNNESDAETLIDAKLSSLGWKGAEHEFYNDRNVWKQRAKTQEEQRKLMGLIPDYVLYSNKNSSAPLAIIEAKKPGSNLDRALKQGIDYAIRIGAPIVFASDGIFVRTYHIKSGRPLFLDGEEVKGFLPENILFNFIGNSDYDRRNKKVVDSKNQLIDIFRAANNELRQDGLTAGIERIGVFSTILFLKLISEIEEINNIKGAITKVPQECVWTSFSTKQGSELLTYVNEISIKYFANFYGRDIFSALNIQKPNILKNIIDMLNPLYFHDMNTDVKGDAFEYFLRTYNAGYKDLGEYFTPRHIIDLMVKLKRKNPD